MKKLGLKKPRTHTPASRCVCGGQCPCHSGVQIAAVSCPPNCPNAGARFDGCHRCDCGKGKHSNG